MATAALVLGIISLVACFIPGINWAGSICGVLAIIFGALAMKKGPEDQKGRAKAGLVLGVISLALGIVVTIICAVCFGAAAGALTESFDLFNSL